MPTRERRLAALASGKKPTKRQAKPSPPVRLVTSPQPGPVPALPTPAAALGFDLAEGLRLLARAAQCLEVIAYHVSPSGGLTFAAWRAQVLGRQKEERHATNG